MKKKKLIISGIVLLVVIVGIYFIFFNSEETSSSGDNQQLRYVSLSQTQVEIVFYSIMSSDFIQDVPESHPIAITFYTFEGNEKVVQDSFLLGEGQLLQEGEPEIYIGIPSKYIDGVEEKGLCDTMKEAVNNGEITFYSESNQASLLLKYRGMLKYRDCFGF